MKFKFINPFLTFILFISCSEASLINSSLMNVNYYDTQTNKSSFGGLNKSSSKLNDTTISQSSSNLFSANNINLKANNINVIASNLKSTNIDIKTDLLNLISSKETNSHTEFKTKSGIITATIEDKGSIKEIEIPAVIEVDNKFILNGKDITNKLDAKTYDKISNSLSSNEVKEKVLKELSSNKTLNIKEINQIKATLNSKEWNDKRTTLSGIGTLIATAVTTYLTAGAGSALAASLGTTGASAATTAAITNAVIANTSIQASNMILSNGKVKFDIDSLTKSALSAGIGSMASSYINSSTYLTNSNLISSNYLDISYADITNTLSSSAIQSGIYGTNFKDSLLSNISSNTGSYLFDRAGDIGVITNSKDGSLTKTALHSLIGGSINAIQGESFIDGAVISGINEMLSPLSKNLNKNEQILTSQLTGILTGALINSEAGAKQGYNLTTSAELNNRQLHQKEIEFIKEKAQEFAIENGISKDEAISRLSSQALRQTDNLWSLMLGNEDIKAKEFLSNTNLTFKNGNKLFTADRLDYKNNRLYLDMAMNNVDFYNTYIHPNISSLPFETVKNNTLNLVSNADKIPSYVYNLAKEQTPSTIYNSVVNLGKNIIAGGISGTNNLINNTINNDKNKLDKIYNYKSVTDDIALLSGIDILNLTGTTAVLKDIVKTGSSKISHKINKSIDEDKIKKVKIDNLGSSKNIINNSKRYKLLNSTQNTKLKNAIDQIYRPNSQIGDGGLADAVRYELKTGKLVGGKSHIQKANERIKNLENIIRKENLNEKDLKIAKDILNDINMALKGK